MGQIVTVDEVFELHKTYTKGTNREWRRKAIKPRAGWIVGFRTVYGGTVVPGSGGDENYEQAYLKIERSYPCVLVAFTPRSKPVHVPLDGYNETTTEEPEYLFPGKYRELLRMESKTWPRDDNGRFAVAFLPLLKG